ncbi:MAG: hypothetical protein M3Y50_17995 [Acidobacteriota bacterium]|nr:hypothetical protein [Acidobacteriota bacterium]
MRWTPLLLLLLCLRAVSAQTPAVPPASSAPPPQAAPPLSPQAAYYQAATPIEITHRAISNWSDVETRSLAVAIAQAKEGCLARTSQTYTGDDLIAFARLCDLGLQWPIVYTAATSYINSKDTSKPRLAQAYAYEVKADLNLRDDKGALNSSIAMLLSVPYDAIADEVTTATIRYLQFASTSDALMLLSRRQPFLLDLIRASHTATSPLPSSVAASALPLHLLFERALEFATLEQYDNQPRLAALILADIDKALPSDPPPDEAILIAADRRQYALLGTAYPGLHGAVSLDPANPTAHFGNATVLLLFPAWCAQCLRQAHEIDAAVARLKDSDVHIFALLADVPPAPVSSASRPAPKPAPTSTRHAVHPAAEALSKPDAPLTAEDQLRGTPALVVPPSMLTSFNAADFPFVIVLDHDDVIRLLQPAVPETALVAGGMVDQVASHILTAWPPPGVAASLPTK